MGFSIVIPELQEEDKLCVYLKQDQEKYRVEMGKSTNGNARRILNVLKNFNQIVDEDFNEMTQTSKRIKELKYSLASQKGNLEYSKRLRKSEKEVEEIRALIKMQ